MGNCIGDCAKQLGGSETEQWLGGAGATDNPGSSQFNDSAFPPDEESLMVGEGGDTYVDLFPSEIEMLQNTDFKRVTEYYAGKELVVFNDIGTDDIKQGQLGNCYYLSAIASLAEFPR